jgi:hypothetical protein
LTAGKRKKQALDLHLGKFLKARRLFQSMSNSVLHHFSSIYLSGK